MSFPTNYYRFANGRFGDGSRRMARQWQPFIDLTADTQTHETLESDSDRFPFLLLNPPAPVPPSSDVNLRALMGFGI